MTVDGSMRRMDDTSGVVRVEEVYGTDIADLWGALSEPDRLARWIATVTGDLRSGGAITASFTSGGAGDGRIEVCDPPTHLVVAMDDGTVMEAWLTSEGSRTRLVVEDRGIPLPELHFHGAGWHAHLEDLERSLRGDDSVWRERWEELTPAYASMPIEDPTTGSGAPAAG